MGVLATENEACALRELITYGLKGMAAMPACQKYGQGTWHQLLHLETLVATLDDGLSVDDLVALALKTGIWGKGHGPGSAHVDIFGNPEMTKVNIGVRDNPAILISGHDLTDLEQLLKQTKGSGVDVYTHGEMLPAHYYPAFKKYEHFVGNYGNAWWQQIDEFVSFGGQFSLPPTASCHPGVKRLKTGYLQRVPPVIPAAPH